MAVTGMTLPTDAAVLALVELLKRTQTPRVLYKIDKVADVLAREAAAEGSTDDLLTQQETARYLRTGVGWMAQARHGGFGPPYTVIGRKPLYHRGHLVAWLMARLHISTSEYFTRRGRGRPRDESKPRCPQCGRVYTAQRQPNINGKEDVVTAKKSPRREAAPGR